FCSTGAGWIAPGSPGARSGTHCRRPVTASSPLTTRDTGGADRRLGRPHRTDSSPTSASSPTAWACPRKSGTSPHAELIRIYPQRSDVRVEAWRVMFERAQTAIEVMVYAAVFLHEQMPDWNDLLRAKAAAGCRVRILIGDPDSQAVRLRGREEKFGHGIESRCRL